MITDTEMYRYLCSFMLQDLRRFSMFGTLALRPYIISAMSCWDDAQKIGMVEVGDDGKIVINKGEAMKKFIEKKSAQFESILDAEDVYDGSKVESILAELEASEQSEMVQFLLGKLYRK
eukprot:TRINITY_DN7415_c0_g1_i1.p1 TRINITY_DN7415_c0_g1~~TRINITY_DN7415_c0_g1_i1.p1  ORF type:complete len:126 (+),score=15.77 TRINITY_DN7415_c0_g1_i1:24-380(+)